MPDVPAHAPRYPHRVAGVVCEPAPQGPIDALGVAVTSALLGAVPQRAWEWIGRRPRLARWLHVEELKD